MTMQIANITFDCEDALNVALFWSAALGRTIDPGGDGGFASIGRTDPDRTLPAFLFERVPEPKSAKNRVHLDVVDSDGSTVERLLSLGATFVATHEMAGFEWTVLQDPEGNEFCVSAKVFVF